MSAGLVKVKLGDTPLVVQQSRWFQEVSVALLNLEGQQLGYATFTITNHSSYNNQACSVYFLGCIRGRVDVDVYDGADHTDYVIRHALEQAGLELEPTLKFTEIVQTDRLRGLTF